MTWQNPLAWMGLLALGVPILIHLLGRGRARVERFPTLRFVQASRLLPTRRTRIHDPLLLAVRLAVLLAAVTALAQPLWLTRPRTAARDRALARAILVDTSASMQRLTTSGTRAIDAARAEAERRRAEASIAMRIEGDGVDALVGGAAAWVGKQEGRREVVVISDFQTGAIDGRAFGAIPPSVGVRLMPIRVRAETGAIEIVTRQGSSDVVSRVSAADERTDVTWTVRPAAASRAVDSIAASPTEMPRALAAVAAAQTIGVRLPAESRTAQPIIVVYPGFDRRAELWRTSTTLRTPWMLDIVARLRADSLLASTARNGAPVVELDDTSGIVVARTATGRSMVVARQGGDALRLFSFADAGSATSAALHAALGGVRSTAPPLSELDPTTLPDSVLAAWQRPAAPAQTVSDGASDGRWLWVLALLLLGVETWLRRGRPAAKPMAIEHDRAA
jgi:hypothetical protein